MGQRELEQELGESAEYADLTCMHENDHERKGQQETQPQRPRGSAWTAGRVDSQEAGPKPGPPLPGPGTVLPGRRDSSDRKISRRGDRL